MEPEKGVNAIAVAAEAVSGMLLGGIDEDTTANIGLISGGKATNIVPEEAMIIKPTKKDGSFEKTPYGLGATPVRPPCVFSSLRPPCQQRLWMPAIRISSIRQ